MKKIITTTLAGLLALSTMQHSVIAMDAEVAKPVLTGERIAELAQVANDNPKTLKALKIFQNAKKRKAAQKALADLKALEAEALRNAENAAEEEPYSVIGDWKAHFSSLFEQSDDEAAKPKADRQQGSSRVTKAMLVVLGVLLGADYVGRERLATSCVPMTKYLVQENDGPGLDTPYKLANLAGEMVYVPVDAYNNYCSEFQTEDFNQTSVSRFAQFSDAACTYAPVDLGGLSAWGSSKVDTAYASWNSYWTEKGLNQDAVIIEDTPIFTDVKQTDAPKLEKTAEQLAAEARVIALKEILSVQEKSNFKQIPFNRDTLKNLNDVKKALLEAELPYTAELNYYHNGADLILVK